MPKTANKKSVRSTKKSTKSTESKKKTDKNVDKQHKDVKKVEKVDKVEKVEKVDKVDKSEEAPPEKVEESLKNNVKQRKVYNKDSMVEEIDNINKMIEDEIKELRENKSKQSGVKFLRSVNKQIKSLKVHATRVMKKTKTTRSNTKSGFQKPVKISKELAEFAGWPEDELRSRVDVTKYICSYIASNKLQKEDDKRQIEPDTRLQKLLGYNPKTAKEPLRYYSIQTHLKKQNHFLN